MQRLIPCGLLLLFTLLAAVAPALALEDDEELLFLQRLYEDQLYEVAANQMEGILERRPDHPGRAEISYLLGQCYLQMGRPVAAMTALAAFVQLRPEDPRACEALYIGAEAGVLGGMSAEAAPLLDRLLRDYAECRRRDAAVLLAARVKADAGDRAAALQLLGYLIEQSGEEELVGRAYYQRAKLKEASDPQAARADLEALKATLPSHPLGGFAALELSRRYEAAGMLAEAIAELDWLIDRFDVPDLAAPARLARAELGEATGRPDLAAEDLAALRREFPEREDLDELAEREIELWIAAGKADRALTQAQDLLRTRGETARIQLLLGDALAAEGKEDAASAAWRRATELDPAGPTGLAALAARFELLVTLDSAPALPAVARQLLARLEDEDDRAQALLQLGDYHRRRGEIRTAEVVWESVSSECADSRFVPESLFRLAELESEAGRWQEAQQRYQRLIKEYGSSARGIQARDRLDALELYYQVDYDAALATLLDLLAAERRPDNAVQRDLAVGRVLLEDLKDFPRAADYFAELATQAQDPGSHAEVLLLAGRAALRERERSALGDGDEKTLKQWGARARQSFEACLASGDEATREEAQLDLTLLRLAELPAGADRLPILDRHLERYPDSPRSARIYYERGTLLSEADWADPAANRQRALEDFQRALALDGAGPWSLRSRLALAQLALEQGNLDLAEQQFRLLIEGAPTRFEGGEALFGLGQTAERRKNYAEALERFERYLLLAPTSPRRPRCLVHIGDCHYFLEEWTEARRTYEILVAEHPDSPFQDDAVFRLALTDEQDGDGEGSRRHLVWLLERGSDRFRQEAAWRLGKAAVESGDAAAARELLEQLMALDGGGRYRIQGALLLGELYGDAGEGKAALKEYEALLAEPALGEARGEAESGRVRALLLLGRLQEADALRESLVASGALSEEKAAELLLATGKARVEAGDGAGAQQAFTRCLQEYPRSESAPWARYEQVLALAQAGRYEEALAGFDELAARQPGSAAAVAGDRRAAGILYNQGHYEAASLRFERALAGSESPDPDLLYYSSLALEKSGQSEAALQRVQQFLAQYPEDERMPEAMMKVGYFLQNLGHYDRAILAYRNAELFQDREGKARLHFWIGDCRELQGDRDGALGDFLKVAYLYGDQGMWGVTATLRAAGIYETSGDLRQARQLYEKILAGQGEQSDFGRAAKEGLSRLETRSEEG